MQRTDEGVVHQISVLHEDGFVRTYTVSDEDFAVIGDCDPDSIELDRRAAQCFIDNKAEKVSKKTIEEVRLLFLLTVWRVSIECHQHCSVAENELQALQGGLRGSSEDNC